jgi:hypothetical protein
MSLNYGGTSVRKLSFGKKMQKDSFTRRLIGFSSTLAEEALLKQRHRKMVSVISSALGGAQIVSKICKIALSLTLF